MICSNCKLRWADFPETDFMIMGELGIVPKTLDAALKREREFDSDEIRLCPVCKDELDKLPTPMEYLFRHITAP
jgi:hypothetical protein